MEIHSGAGECLHLAAGLIVGALSVTMYEVMAGHILRIFIAEPETVRLGTDFLRIRCLATPLMFMSFFVLNHFIGMYGIVWSQVTADILTVALSAFVYFRFRSRLIRGEASV